MAYSRELAMDLLHPFGSGLWLVWHLHGVSHPHLILDCEFKGES